jgi:hypothetical protein
MVSSRGKAVLAFALTSLIVAFTQIRSGNNGAVSKEGLSARDESSVRRRLQDTSQVTSISLMGERHSGTNWITDHLTDCFGDDLIVSVD